MSTRDDAGARRHYVVRISAQRFALAADRVEELLTETRLHALGAVPAHLAGVIRRREEWIPAVDPRPLLGLDGACGAAALVLRRGAQAYALLVDAFEGVRMVHEDEIETDHDAVRGRCEYIEDGHGTVTLLDADSLFRTPAPRHIDTHAQERAMASERVVLAFAVGAFELALPVECVLAALAMPADLRRDAQAVPGLLGFMDHDGEIVPVLSLAHRLRAGDAQATRVLVISTPKSKVAAAVERVTGFVSVPVERPGDAHGLLQTVLARAIRGVLRSAKGPLVELDAAGLLEEAEWDALRAAAPAASKSA